MVLTNRIESPGRIVLVLEGDDEGKTVEQILAEAICKLNRPGEGISSWAIHFCSMRHPFSTTQRLRELGAKFEKWWNGDLIKYLNPGEPLVRGSDDYSYRWVKAENRYYFSPHFIEWLRREYLDEKE